MTYDGKTATTGSKCGENEKEEITGPTSENSDTTKTKGLIKIVYLDPTDLTKTCTKEDAEKNLNEKGTPTGIKTGCMKWYAYKDDGTNYTMILDHNTTPLVAYNSTKSNTEMKEVQDELNELTTSDIGWKVTPRLITADEIAEITGNNTFNIETTDSNGYFYFETNTSIVPNPYKGTYAWLYDYTNECTSYGCDIVDSNKYKYGTAGSTNSISGYWTSTPVFNCSYCTWFVWSRSCLGSNDVDLEYILGLRPVITVEKSIIN